MKEIDPQRTNRAQQFEIWKNAPNPMLVFVKKIDVWNLPVVCIVVYITIHLLSGENIQSISLSII